MNKIFQKRNNTKKLLINNCHVGLLVNYGRNGWMDGKAHRNTRKSKAFLFGFKFGVLGDDTVLGL